MNTTWQGERRRGRVARGCVYAVGAVAAFIVAAVAVYSLLPRDTRTLFYYKYIDQFAEHFGLNAPGAAERAEERFRAGDLDGAMKWANRAIAMADQSVPRYHAGYQVRGRVYDARGDYDRAVNDYTAHIRLMGSGGTQVLRARVYEKIGKPDLAVEDYRAVIQQWRGKTKGMQTLAAIRTGRTFMDPLSEGDFVDNRPRECADSLAEMIKLFDDAIKRKPDDKDLHTCREWLASAKDAAIARAEKRPW
jgi:tetratricopeptide (TPR) repeat protein